ncbi:MAG TPA: hemolysin III family protein [Terrimicrobiaceae bacterium]
MLTVYPFHRCGSQIAYCDEIDSQDGQVLFVMRVERAASAALALDLEAITLRPSCSGAGNPSMNTQQSLREERANTWSAAFGMLGSIAFALILLWRGDASAGQWIFATALLGLFLTSTIYHGLASERAKEVARILDHCAIFVLIAGTYTPFALGPLRDHGGLMLFTLEWLLTLIGVLFVLCGGLNRLRASNALYIGMGWMGLFFTTGFLTNVSPIGNGLILAGGLIYTAGVGFYSARGWRYSHLVWHLFVIAGSTCHAVAVYAYSGR